tara:strand:+ start:3638 stop:3784 length:147 start_codon:yes stop_codon:yes gene_type:complete
MKGNKRPLATERHPYNGFSSPYWKHQQRLDVKYWNENRQQSFWTEEGC